MFTDGSWLSICAFPHVIQTQIAGLPRSNTLSVVAMLHRKSLRSQFTTQGGVVTEKHFEKIKIALAKPSDRPSIYRNRMSSRTPDTSRDDGYEVNVEVLARRIERKLRPC